MSKKIILALAAIVIVAGAYAVVRASDEPTQAASSAPAQGGAIVSVSVPEALSAKARLGETAFNAVCAACHGANASGVEGSGPPLVHKIYEPSHHGDMAFIIAVQRGVQAHHWRFGNMPPQDGLTAADVQGIVTYVRELQRANGIN